MTAPGRFGEWRIRGRSDGGNVPLLRIARVDDHVPPPGFSEARVSTLSTGTGSRRARRNWIAECRCENHHLLTGTASTVFAFRRRLGRGRIQEVERPFTGSIGESPMRAAG